jgi:hypothetical protein
MWGAGILRCVGIWLRGEREWLIFVTRSAAYFLVREHRKLEKRPFAARPGANTRAPYRPIALPSRW